MRRRMAVKVSLAVVLGALCYFGLIVAVARAEQGIMGALKRVDIRVGSPARREPNINNLKVGPRGWLFGSTEEDGYLFVLDPQTDEHWVWDAGDPPSSTGSFAGDITDFVVWEENGRLLLLACHADLAAIYRFDVPIPARGLPKVTRDDQVLVYENRGWARVMSIERGCSATGEPMLLAGSYRTAEVVRSDDDGRTWTPFDYTAGWLDAAGYRDALTPYAAIVDIHYRAGTWLMALYHGFFQEGESPQTGPYWTFLNGLLVSHDGGDTWHFAEVEPNPASAYALVGECVQGIVDLPDGRLLAATAMDNTPEPPFGGRVLESSDSGETWRETFAFPATDAYLLPLHDGSVLASLATKTTRLPAGAAATGEVWLSKDGGNSFLPLGVLLSERNPSAFRHPTIWVTGVVSMAVTGNTVYFGTVNEASYAELFRLDLTAFGELSPTTDLNRDGRVDVFDLAAAAQGRGDADGNGVVDVEDVRRVARTFGWGAAPASLRTRLYPNYPNPSNPGTWIPFTLKESADVTIRIFDVKGTLVRKLDMGRREAGSYRGRLDAAYWDGNNEFGEHVASGVYVHEFRAGAYRAASRAFIWH